MLYRTMNLYARWNATVFPMADGVAIIADSSICSEMLYRTCKHSMADGMQRLW